MKEHDLIGRDIIRAVRHINIRLHGKNDFAEGSKILLGYRSENNFVGPSK